MSYSYKDLREISLEKLIEEHDLRAKDTVVGTQYYLDEIRRRDNKKSNYGMLMISKITLTVAFIFLIVAVIVIFIK